MQDVVLFISYCFEKGLAPKTISTYIAGINYYHRVHNWSGVTDVFVVKKMLEGCHRSRRTKDERAPITKVVLQAICCALPSVCYDSFETTLFKALFVVAYFGLFRVSELVSPSNTMRGSPIQFSDVNLDTQGKSVNICLHTFKTNHRGATVTVKLPCETDDSNICPVGALQAFVTVRPKIQGPFFCHASGMPVIRQQFSAVLSKCIAKTKFSSAHYRSHSFRIGRASDLAAMGISMKSIMQLGRWQSQAYKLYLR